jgi:hypothetical protein
LSSREVVGVTSPQPELRPVRVIGGNACLRDSPDVVFEHGLTKNRGEIVPTDKITPRSGEPRWAAPLRRARQTHPMFGSLNRNTICRDVASYLLQEFPVRIVEIQGKGSAV